VATTSEPVRGRLSFDDDEVGVVGDEPFEVLTSRTWVSVVIEGGSVDVVVVARDEPGSVELAVAAGAEVLEDAGGAVVVVPG